MCPIGSPETSIWNYLTQRNNPEDRIILFLRYLVHSVRASQTLLL
jgi:hypothetical protein